MRSNSHMVLSKVTNVYQEIYKRGEQDVEVTAY